MSNYTKTTDFEAKDSLPTGDSGKIIRGAEFETEFDAISTAIATKADTAGPTFTGTLTFETISDGTIGVTAFVDEDNMASDSATLVPTQQSVKAYVDSVTTELNAQDLDFQADSGGALSIDLDTETITFTGGTGIDTTGALNEVTFAIDSTVATLTGTQTLTNKTLTAPTISGNLTTDGNIDGRDVATDGAKLDGIEAGATADQTDAEIRAAVEAATDSNVFTDADHTKLDGIEASATADQTDAEIRAAVEAATDSNVFTDADHTKLDGIEANATADQTDAEIRAAVEAATDSNVFTDADHTKLDGIEALADVTDTTNVTAAGALMDSELTNLTAVKSLDQGVATTDTPTFTGLTTTADVSFGDNDKAIFGAGSDLQIYHSGSASIIGDFGTGDLLVRGENLKLQNTAGENYLVATNNDATRLYHDSAEKLATTSTGIDVTGNVTADGLTVDGDGATVASVNATTGTGVVGLRVNNTGGNTFLGISNSAGGGYLASIGNYATALVTEAATNLALGTNNAKRLLIGSGGDISFYEDTGTTAKFFWDSSAESLTLTGGGLSMDVTAGTVPIDIDTNISSTEGSVDILKAKTINNYYSGVTLVREGSTNTGLAFKTTGSGTYDTRMTIDASGNVGIGTDDPSKNLHVYNGTTNRPALIESGDADSLIEFKDNSTTNAPAVGATGNNFIVQTGSSATERMRIDSSGLIQAVTSITSDPTTTNAYFYNKSGVGPTLSGYRFSIRTGATPDESLRVDESGNLLVGNTNTLPQTLTSGGGFCYAPDSSLRIARQSDGTGQPIVDLNNTGSDDELIRFRKDGLTVGSIATNSSRFELDGSGNPVRMKAGTSNIQVNNNTHISFDIAGGEAARFDASASLLVGTTSESTWESAKGFRARNSGSTTITRDGNPPLYVNRLSSDGTLLQFQKGTAVVGSIGVDNSDNLYISGGSGHGGVEFGTNAVIPSSNGVAADATVKLGNANYRYTDLYLSGGAYLGGTAAANKLDDYEEGTWTPVWSPESGTIVTNTSFSGGSYTKIGNIVHVHARLYTNNVTSPTGEITISGLPFAVENNNENRGMQLFTMNAITGTLSGVPVFYFKENTSTAIVLDKVWDSTEYTGDIANHFDNDTWGYFYGVYRTA